VDYIHGGRINFSHSLAIAIPKNNLNCQQSTILHFFPPPLRVMYPHLATPPGSAWEDVKRTS
jgi:hypothetical protein